MEKEKLQKSTLDFKFGKDNKFNFIPGNLTDDSLFINSLFQRDEFLGRNQLGNMLLNTQGEIFWVNKRALALLKIDPNIPVRHINEIWKGKNLNKIKSILLKPDYNDFLVEKLTIKKSGKTPYGLYVSVQDFNFPDNNRIFLFTLSTSDIFTTEPFTELDFMQEMIVVQDKERENIGSMLHDSIAQILYGIRLNLQHFILTHPEHSKRIKEVKEMLNESIFQIRNLSKELSLSTLRDYGLKTAIEKMVEKINVPALKITTHFDCEAAIPSTYQLTLFKITQELLNNALKHSGASSIHISLKCRDEILAIEVRDDGCGIRKDINTVLDNGTGLRTLMNRVALLNGKVVISRRTKGCVVRAELKIMY
jgi:two-component sensor histidine kinase